MTTFTELWEAMGRPSPFEAGMLVCFGASWPASVRKLWIGKTSEGKSFLFLWLIFIGYICGTTHKMYYSRDLVIGLYIFNLCMVGIDISLSYRYRKRVESSPGTPIS
jgi:hypothetical protein